MIQEGQIVLFRFPQTNQAQGKLRPALVIRGLPGPHGDWLVSMVSTQLAQAIPGFDEVAQGGDPDFAGSGLRAPSVIRISRLAFVAGTVLLGSIGHVAPERLRRIRTRLSRWIAGLP